MKLRTISKLFGLAIGLSSLLLMSGCSANDGSDGMNGQTSLMSIVSEAPGDNCTNGGQKIQIGLDLI